MVFIQKMFLGKILNEKLVTYKKCVIEKKTYSNEPNKRACMFFFGKVCLLGSIKVRRQTLPEINMHACLFGTL